MTDTGGTSPRFFRPVRELAGEVARKIAAGEVIDRPSAVVRELLDNAIDSGADTIDIEIEGGGIDRIRVRDNGHGMTKEDLSLCTHTHTTSKLVEEDDLLSLSTLGFRGEALSSIQAVSSLEITTARDGQAWKLDGNGITPGRLPKGTIVELRGLFANFPARRQFLKRPASEAALCRQIFIEKALAWPAITFRYSSGSKPLILPAADTLRERVLAALSPAEQESFFHAVETSAEGFSATVIAGTPDVPRANRKNLLVFVNGRRIQEYSLIQALEYGAEGYFPNGTHPFSVLFLTVDPSLVDFNIHPAKREARFRDPGAIHHAVSSMMRNFYRNCTLSTLVRRDNADRTDIQPAPALFADQAIHPVPPVRFTRDSFAQYDEKQASARYAADLAGEALGTQSQDRGAAGDALPVEGAPSAAVANEPSAAVANTDTSVPQGSGDAAFRYLGQTLGTFLVVEHGDALVVIDQHAAHERIIFNTLMEKRDAVQELLVPYRIETASEAEDALLEKNTAALEQAGFACEKAGPRCWQITAVPSRWKGTEQELRGDLLSAGREPESLVRHLFARAACRAAVKDGDLLDPETARTIASQALRLTEPVCPHGRPVWTVIDRDELFQRVRRT